MHSRRWYDVGGRSNCVAIYVVRAEAAVSWLVAIGASWAGQARGGSPERWGS